MMSKFKCGQSLTEYALPIALIGVMGVLSLFLLGNNLNKMFTNTIGTKNTAMLTVTDTSGANGGDGLRFTPTNLSFHQLRGKLVQINLGNGKSLNLNLANPVAVADSAGGNGVTENAVTLIQQIAQQLKEQGEDPSKIAELEKLALSGQKIKDIQKLIETKLPKEGFKSNEERFNFLINPANNIVVEGKEIPLLNASYLININSMSYDSVFNSTPIYSDYLNYNSHYLSYNGTKINISGTQKEFSDFSSNNSFSYKANNPAIKDYEPLSEFMTQLKKVEDTGLLKNTILNQLVKDDLSFQIYQSANQTIVAPTKTEVSELVKTTLKASNDICTLSKSVTCKDRN